jgi:hypothetical protein
MVPTHVRRYLLGAAVAVAAFLAVLAAPGTGRPARPVAFGADQGVSTATFSAPYLPIFRGPIEEPDSSSWQ